MIYCKCYVFWFKSISLRQDIMLMVSALSNNFPCSICVLQRFQRGGGTPLQEVQSVYSTVPANKAVRRSEFISFHRVLVIK